jgi:flagellar protein FliS
MRDRMFNSYKATEINTSDPGRLITMLYERAIRSLENARAFATQQKHEGRCKQLARVRDIVSELLVCLNFEEGGRLADSLASLYSYILRRIIDADVRNDPQAIEDCLSVLITLYDGWRQIVEPANTKRAATADHFASTVAGITA